MSSELYEAARALLAARTEHAVRQTAVRTFAHLTSADRCEVLQPVDGRLESRTSVAFGPSAPDTPGPLSTHRTILEHAYEHGAAGQIDDVAAVRAAGAAEADVDPGGYRSILCVPIDDHGLLVAADRDVGAFDTIERESTNRLADLVAAALDRFASSGRDEPARLDAVATVLSHDVQNRIGVANGRLELAMEGDYHEQLDEVERAHRRLLDLTDDLVTVLRTGDSVHAIEPVELGTEARRAWSAVDAPEATLSVAADARLMADASSLCQLLENLLRNAVDHGGPDVAVVVGARQDRTGFYVADDGPGIPAADRETVFEMGYTTGEVRTGYGLAIVERVAAAHGWTVEASESEAGGARFDVTGVDVVRLSPRTQP